MSVGEMAIHAAKQIKHRGFVINKHARRWTTARAWEVHDAAFTAWAKVRPYRFDPARYPGEFITQDPPVASLPSELPRVLWCCWTGDNPLTPNRERGLASLIEQNPELEVRLVTRDTLADWVLPEAPLHPAYENLSLVHRSDYLRCYLLHHYGGGYCDIKPIDRGWLPSFELLAAEPTKWALGFRELSSRMAAILPGPVGRDIARYHSILIGTSAVILRSRTPLTTEWFAELNRRLDAFAPRLAEHPGDARGDNPGYPIRWTGILGDIFQPLGLKYADRLIIDERIRPRFTDYQ